MRRGETRDTLAWTVEETCRNAWPGLYYVHLGGWLVRLGTGFTRRGNSASPLAPRLDDLMPLIPEVRALFAARGRPAIFRVPTLLPPRLDAHLEGLGFTGEGETCVLYGASEAVPAAPDPEVRLDPAPSREWFAAMSRLQRHDRRQRAVYPQIAARLAIPVAFASLAIGGEIAALAYGAVHRGLLCYESVITDARYRRSGHARRILSALADWGKARGVAGFCLEVEAANFGARALYDAFGLNSELYRYHYRREPAQ
ncbi:MAG TPA: GNAT family N-acetyltransferase [Stellaceae bacterium]|nr:GNAT family N-acetyltransferase [Stellaceae bacterium]